MSLFRLVTYGYIMLFYSIVSREAKKAEKSK